MVRLKIPNGFNLRSLIHEKLLPDEKLKLALSVIYPTAIDVEWSFKNNGYEATFTQGGTYRIAHFSEKGILNEEKISCSEKQLPNNISEILNSRYRLLFLVSALEIHRAEKIVYEIIFDSEDKSRYLLLFDEKGMLIKEQLLVAIRKDMQ